MLNKTNAPSRTAVTPADFALLASAFLINPERGTVRWRGAVPTRGILPGDDAGYYSAGSLNLCANGLTTTRAKLIWYVANGAPPERMLQHISGDSDAIGNLRLPVISPAKNVGVTTSGKFRAQVSMANKLICGASRATVAEAEADAALLLKARDAIAA